MEVDDIIKRLAWPAKLYGGSRRNRECDQGSRARDWEIEDHDVVTAEKWGAVAGATRFGASRNKFPCNETIYRKRLMIDQRCGSWFDSLPST